VIGLVRDALNGLEHGKTGTEHGTHLAAEDGQVLRLDLLALLAAALGLDRGGSNGHDDQLFPAQARDERHFAL